MSVVYKRTIPLLITATCLILLILEYFLAIPILKDMGLQLQSWAVLIMAFATGIGFVTILRHHGMRALKRQEDWYLSIWLLVVMFIFTVLGLGFGQDSQHFKWLYDNVYSALSSTTYSILALFITSASFRAFRARNLDATVLLLSGFFVLIGNTPASAAIYSGFPVIGEWIMKVPTVAATRVIVIGAALGMVTLGLRIMLGKETGFLGGGGED